ncbi:MAG: family 43 glycosylhydrolase [Prolixibacteraceae bacterium]|nr:family 43 glycosylhydrolase [Prolixibacteraceae bacterium]
MKYASVIKIVVFTLTFILVSQAGIAKNPIKKDAGMADPHIRIFNNKAYLFTTRDAEKDAKSFIMPDWHIWSSDDLVNWKHETTIYPSETYMGKSNNCWAPDAVEKNGKYYFYFSNKNINTGVMVADSPTGPYKDALGKPMLDVDLTTTKEYDPTVLIENDGTAYIVFGHYRKTDPDLDFYIAKLSDDMISLAEHPKPIEINGNLDVLAGNDKPTLHKKNGLYYLSAGSHYATATNVYGPYERRGNSGNDKYGLNSRAHGNYFDWNNQSFHTWCHFHLGKDVGRYRESYITYLHYKENGEMVSDTDFLDQHFETGVGQYDAGWDKIEAEWYMAAENIEKREGTKGGFEVVSNKKNGAIYFPNMNNLNTAKVITLLLASEGNSTIEIYSNLDKKELLGTCKINNTKGNYEQFSCKLSNTKNAENMYVKFKDNTKVNLDSFQIK